MIFRCKSCGGNTVYSPERKKMYCPYCDGEDTQEQVPSEGMFNCPACGGELKIGDYNAALRCEYCDSYVIVEERTTGKYEPKLILPFIKSHKEAEEILKNEFGKQRFLPDDFLSDAKLSGMEGMYVPFFLYDFDVRYTISATGHKVRTWTSGNYQYTEDSLYQVERSIIVPIEKMPADASYEKPDEIMDLMEPYDYSQMESFDPKFLSGFLAEQYNMESEELLPRVQIKGRDDAKSITEKTITGYTSMTNRVDQSSFRQRETTYAMLPVWTYFYKYKDKTLPFYINGQTGKLVGQPPISGLKVLIYSGTVFAGMIALLSMWNILLGML
ncbi:MAG: hypothetical protein K5739_01835 [Lachnospiraceae bacterium]|nr:hypothetical protein [Lachnospiraceae bacterium]